MADAVIAFDRLGAGPPVILVGGGPTDRSANAPLAALLAPRFTVINYDRRGRGDSGDTPPYAVEREIEDLQALIDEAGGSASVYGTSSGAVFALEAAARGLPITKLALWEPPFIVDDSRPPVPKDYKAQLSEMVSAEGGTAPWLSNTAAAVAAAIPDAQRRTLNGQPHNVAPEAIAPALEAFFAG